MVKLNKKAYKQLIKEDIASLELCMAEYSLEKRHVIEVLIWSIKQKYPDVDEDTFCPHCGGYCMQQNCGL